MRLIDADEYIEKLRDRIRIEPTWNHGGLRIAIYELHEMPTIVPVKRGRIIEHKTRGAWGHTIHERWECSECGYTEVWAFNYCPNCGADVRGEE